MIAAEPRELVVDNCFVNCNYLPMKNFILFCLAVVSLSVALFFCGCETADETSGLSISPSTSTCSNKGDVVYLSVGGTFSNAVNTIVLPYMWSVSDPSLGGIQGEGGNSAVYVSNGGSGANVITVRDQTGAQGVASVQHIK